MGSYLDKPVTAKASSDGEVGSKRGQFAVSSMQGWRKSMEDAHVAQVSVVGPDDPLGQVSMFAVFDGHGGSEVAKFCAKYMAREIVTLEDFQKGNFGEALIKVFHKMDDMLRDAKYAVELAALKTDKGAPISGKLDEALSENSSEQERQANKKADGGAGGEDEEEAQSELTTKETMHADVQRRMQAAEKKGHLDKSEALELVMTMLKLKKMGPGDEKSSTGAGSGSTARGVAATDAGCTAIVSLIHKNKIYVANAGDSRGVLCRAGRAVAMSHDHKPKQKSEMTRIVAAGGYVNDAGRVNANLSLSRAIGDLRYKTNDQLPADKQIITAQPDIRVFDITDDDIYMVLACDGVFDVMSNDELVNFISERLTKSVAPVSQVLEEVFEHCLCDNPAQAEGIGADNMSAVIVLLKP
eukprot:CAMPEP_0184554124 /NCGR_PEP_ID=MMETSP0199_2-20130426/34112_1 /TAXON_ID=1112570 /ORGANISM="Thraustochytrium sp., Strain LLF1b" /LENGTH=411 /DNA_ID=CAMNT_0026950059 /DNA_START=249 /DNA_END=1481 /DNA_ORIENTATION=-